MIIYHIEVKKMGFGPIVYEKEREILVFKHGDLEGIVKVCLMLETGRWTYVNVTITGKLRQQCEEGHSEVELDKKDLSIEVRDQDSLTTAKEEINEAVKTMKEALRELENKILMSEEFIDNYIRQDI